MPHLNGRETESTLIFETEACSLIALISEFILQQHECASKELLSATIYEMSWLLNNASGLRVDEQHHLIVLLDLIHIFS